MIWAGIIGGIMVGPQKVPDGVKMNAHTYVALPKKHLQP